MPLKPSQVLSLLQAKQADFKAFNQRAFKDIREYHQALAHASQQSQVALEKALADHVSPGARPLETLGHSNWIVPSNLVWQSREQSLEWVRDRLMGISTFAVDGS